jgi:hypothetical protein
LAFVRAEVACRFDDRKVELVEARHHHEEHEGPPRETTPDITPKMAKPVQQILLQYFFNIPTAYFQPNAITFKPMRNF